MSREYQGKLAKFKPDPIGNELLNLAAFTYNASKESDKQYGSLKFSPDSKGQSHYSSDNMSVEKTWIPQKALEAFPLFSDSFFPLFSAHNDEEAEGGGRADPNDTIIQYEAEEEEGGQRTLSIVEYKFTHPWTEKMIVSQWTPNEQGSYIGMVNGQSTGWIYQPETDEGIAGGNGVFLVVIDEEPAYELRPISKADYNTKFKVILGQGSSASNKPLAASSGRAASENDVVHYFWTPHYYS